MRTDAITVLKQQDEIEELPRPKTAKACTLTHSLFRQGAMLYDLIPMMPEPRVLPPLQRYAARNPCLRRRLWGYLKMRGFMRWS